MRSVCCCKECRHVAVLNDPNEKKCVKCGGQFISMEIVVSEWNKLANSEMVERITKTIEKYNGEELPIEPSDVAKTAQTDVRSVKPQAESKPTPKAEAQAESSLQAKGTEFVQASPWTAGKKDYKEAMDEAISDSEMFKPTVTPSRENDFDDGRINPWEVGVKGDNATKVVKKPERTTHEVIRTGGAGQPSKVKVVEHEIRREVTHQSAGKPAKSARKRVYVDTGKIVKIVLFVLMGVAVLGVIGYGAWSYIRSNSSSAQEEVVEAAAAIEVKDVPSFMDEYERFIDGYIAFMKEYKSDPKNTVLMIMDYKEYGDKYREYERIVDELSGTEMAQEDKLYYIEVNARVREKLSQINN